MDGNSRTRRNLGMVIALVLAVGTLGIGIASGQTSGNTYTACLKGGTLTKVAIGSDPLSPCSKNATEINWNETGQPGVLGFYTVSDCAGINPACTQDEIAPGGDATLIAHCDPGDVVTGGGWIQSAIENHEPMDVSANGPTNESTAWLVHVFHNGSTFDLGASVYANCADLTP
jgi:hypothetical protein